MWKFTRSQNDEGPKGSYCWETLLLRVSHTPTLLAVCAYMQGPKHSSHRPFLRAVFTVINLKNEVRSFSGTKSNLLLLSIKWWIPYGYCSFPEMQPIVCAGIHWCSPHYRCGIWEARGADANMLKLKLLAVPWLKMSFALTQESILPTSMKQ